MPYQIPIPAERWAFVDLPGELEERRWVSHKWIQSPLGHWYSFCTPRILTQDPGAKFSYPRCERCERIERGEPEFPPPPKWSITDPVYPVTDPPR